MMRLRSFAWMLVTVASCAPEPTSTSVGFVESEGSLVGAIEGATVRAARERIEISRGGAGGVESLATLIIDGAYSGWDRAAVDPNCIRTEGAIVHRLTLGAEGLHHEVEVASEPSDDLVVRVGLEGARCTSVDDAGALLVSDADPDFALRYTHGVWIGGDGSREPIPVVCAEGELLLRVPTLVLGRTVYPAVLDPVLSVEASPTGRDPARREASSASPVIAWNGAWASTWGPSFGHLWSSRTDPGGAMLAPGSTHVGRMSGRSDAHDLFADTGAPGAIAAFATRRDDDTVALVAGSIDVTGAVGPLVTLLDDPPYLDVVEVLASGPDHVVVIAPLPSGIRLWRLARAGLTLDRSLTIPAPSSVYSIAVASSGPDIVLLWKDLAFPGPSMRLGGVVLDTALASVASLSLPLGDGTASHAGAVLSLACDAMRCALAHVALSGVRGMTFDPRGSAEPTYTVWASRRGSITSVALATRTSDFALVWVDTGWAEIGTVASDGVVGSSTVTFPLATFGATSVASAGDRVGVAWPGEDGLIQAYSVDPAARDVRAISVARRSSAQRGAVLVRDPTRRFAVWMDETLGVAASVVDDDGQPSPPISICRPSNCIGVTALVATGSDGGGFWAAWRYTSSFTTQWTIVRVDATGAPIESSRVGLSGRDYPGGIRALFGGDELAALAGALGRMVLVRHGPSGIVTTDLGPFAAEASLTTSRAHFAFGPFEDGVEILSLRRSDGVATWTRAVGLGRPTTSRLTAIESGTSTYVGWRDGAGDLGMLEMDLAGRTRRLTVDMPVELGAWEWESFVDDGREWLALVRAERQTSLRAPVRAVWIDPTTINITEQDDLTGSESWEGVASISLDAGRVALATTRVDMTPDIAAPRLFLRTLVRQAALGARCGRSDACGSGHCVDGGCCESSCGGGRADDCLVCMSDGTCGYHDGHECRPSTGPCDPGEECPWEGSSPACPSDQLFDGEWCSGDGCAVESRCMAGVCQATVVVDCDDGLSCTTDRCEPESGCVHDLSECDAGTPLPDDAGLVRDAGMGLVDSGSEDLDAGPRPLDGGAPLHDAMIGSALDGSADSGTMDAGDDDGREPLAHGCSCRVGAPPSRPAELTMLALIMGCLLARRIRRRCARCDERPARLQRRR